MKKHYSYRFLLFGLLLCGTLHAEINNYVGAYGQVGEWSLIAQQSSYGASFGVNGGVGFQYELQSGSPYSKTRFLFDIGLGAWGGMSNFSQRVNQVVPLANQTDLSGDMFNYIYTIHDRHDGYSNIAVQMPILFGVQHQKFYMLAGVKIGYNALSTMHTSALITTYGEYKATPNIYNTPEYQFFKDYPKNTSGKAMFADVTADVTLEVGGRLGFVTYDKGHDVPQRKVEYRLAGFIDYGLLDIHKAGTLAGLTPPAKYDTDPYSDTYVYKSTSMVDGLEMNDVMSTSGFARSVNSLTIGIKFTVLFQLPKAGDCILCRDSYENLARPSSGRSVMKDEE